jgi:hypothetical protein
MLPGNVKGNEALAQSQDGKSKAAAPRPTAPSKDTDAPSSAASDPSEVKP